VLALIAEYREISAWDIAVKLGITERSVRRIIDDLESEGYISKRKVGRSNRYTVRRDQPLRQPGQRDTAVGELLNVLMPSDTDDE
jgi:predicted ArsR family transcriptional regulator